MVFAVALGYPLARTLLSYIIYVVRFALFPPTSSASISTGLDDATSLLFILLDTVGVFALFYFFGKTIKIGVVRAVTLASFFGFSAGYLLSLLPMLINSTELGNPLGITFIGTIFQLFFPALAALLYVEFRGKRSNSASTT